MSDENTDDELNYAVNLSLTRPTVLKFSRTPLGPTTTSKKKNVPAAGPSNTDDKKQNVDAEASETKAFKLFPKKRKYVVLKTQSEDKQIRDNIAIVGEQTEAVKEVIDALPTNQVQNQSGATDKKSQAPELAASDKPTVKPVRETEKKQSQKASASKPSTRQASALQPSTSETLKSRASTSKASKSKAPTTKESKSKASTTKASKSKATTTKASKSKASKPKESTSKASKSKSRASTSKTTKKTSSTPDNSEVRKGADANLPSGKKPSASTSAASSSSADSHIWLETLKTKFQCSAYDNLLRESNFTEQQAAVLKNLFHQTSRQMHNAFMNIDRVTKIHSCRECGFSICHQCVSINFLPVGWARADPKIATKVAPRTMTICICQFAFFHDHISRPSLSKTVNTGSLKRIITSLRCPVCDTMVMIEHPQVENTGCTLTKWSGINSSDEEAFHAKLVDHLKTLTQQTLSLDELYTCNHHCCLFFHRCTE